MALLASLLSACGPRSESGPAPKEVVINSGAGTQYVQATAVAAAVEKHTPMMAFVEPTKSHVAAMPLFQRGEMDFIFVSQAEMYLANRGAEYYESVGPTPIRVVAAGSEIMFGFFTSPGTGIETLKDLAGHKVMWDTKTNGVFYWAAKYVLDYYGLHDEIVSIPSPSPVDRAEALKSGRVDAYSCSVRFSWDLHESRMGWDFDGARLTGGPLDYYRMFYCDTVLQGNTPALMCAFDFFGEDHMLFGTDAPYDNRMGERVYRATIEAVEAMDISESARKKIFEDNARRIFRLPA